MQLNRVLVVYKRSTFEIYNEEGYSPSVKKLIDKQHIAVKNLKNSHDTHQDTVDSIIGILESYGIKIDVIFRGDLRPIQDQEYDLIITTGGDGTILETSKYLSNTPILGVNSDPRGSVGFFTGANKLNFKDKLQQVMQNQMETLLINRIQLYINDNPIKELALNDILICHQIPAATSRYIIRNKGREEFHRSSGIWVSTAAGSTAGIRSAGGKVMPIESEQYQYVIREFYDRGSKDFELLGSICDFEESLEIISQMRLGKLYIDGPFFDHPFTVGDKLTFKKSATPLKLLGFDYGKREAFVKSHRQAKVDGKP